jgi:hypothetical protein
LPREDVLAALLFAMLTARCRRLPRKPPPPLVAASTTMVTLAGPARSQNDPTLADPRLGQQVKWGYSIFTDTPRYAPHRPAAGVVHQLPSERGPARPCAALVGVAGMFPEITTAPHASSAFPIASSTAS